MLVSLASATCCGHHTVMHRRGFLGDVHRESNYYIQYCKVPTQPIVTEAVGMCVWGTPYEHQQPFTRTIHCLHAVETYWEFVSTAVAPVVWYKRTTELGASIQSRDNATSFLYQIANVPEEFSIRMKAMMIAVSVPEIAAVLTPHLFKGLKQARIVENW